jgi:hypothetical protein
MKKILMIILSLILVTGCTTKPVAKTDRNEEYNFMAVQSYFIVGDEKLKNPMISDIDRDRFNEAISHEFTLQGLVLAKEKTGADILISYFVVTQDKMKVNSSGHSAYYGHSSRYGRAYGYGYGTPNVNVKNYTEGTFVVDVIDNKTQKTVWRSTLVKPIKHYDTIEERKDAITALINTMFGTLKS